MPTRPKLVLRKNDRVVFLGDSITEQQLYTNYVETYLATRYPELNLTFFNAGWGGDRAPGGVERLERDVLALKPTVVTVCYGMNDASYQLPTPEILKAFNDGMRELVSRLKLARVRVVLLTPGFGDISANASLKAVDYNRKGLRKLADAVLALAKKEKLPVFDIHKLMTEVDAKGKRAVKGFNMAPDGFHPNPAGHLVMAYGLLKALGVPDLSQKVKVHVGKGGASSLPGVKVQAKALNDGHGFSLALDRPPFYVETEALKVLRFLPFQEDFNHLVLQIQGLESGSYYFRTDMVRSQPFSKKQLEQGIDLYALMGLPAMAEAQALHKFTFEKCQVYFKLWRQMALKGGSTDYTAAPHQAAVAAMPKMELARQKMAVSAPFSISLRKYSHKSAGEPVGEGDFISCWSCLGPFPLPHAKDYLGGEAAFSSKVPKKSRGWQTVDLDLKAPGNNLGQIFGGVADCSAYAVTVLDSPVEQSATLLLGSDDGYAVWLNGRQLVERLELRRGLMLDQDSHGIQLKKGKNVLLLKISQAAGGWGFCVRLKGLSQDLVAHPLG